MKKVVRIKITEGYHAHWIRGEDLIQIDFDDDTHYAYEIGDRSPEAVVGALERLIEAIRRDAIPDPRDAMLAEREKDR